MQIRMTRTSSNCALVLLFLHLVVVAGRSGEADFASQNSIYNGESLPETLASVGAWSTSLPFRFICEGDYVGPANPKLCVERLLLKFWSPDSGNVTVQLDNGQIDELKTVDAGNSSRYVYPVLSSQYVLPNVLYSAEVEVRTEGSKTKTYPIPPKIYSGFNATGLTLRSYYGVPDNILGSDRVAQATALIPGAPYPLWLNTTIVQEYLAGLGIIPNNPVKFFDWAPNDPTNANEYNFGAIQEGMLDVETLNSVAPLSSTYFLPTGTPWGLEKALKAAGLSADQTKRTIRAWNSSQPAASPENVTALLQLGVEERAALGSFFDEYLREFVRNMTQSPETKPQVLSLSWNSGFYPALGVSYDDLESILEDLTLNHQVTILVASGDNGASADEDGCLPAGNPLVGNQDDMWPIISPWVTVVGGTQFLTTEDNPGGEEVVVSSLTPYSGINSQVTSGGGFAGYNVPQDLYSMPAWQEAAVQRYLAENNNTTFAGFPTNDTPGYNPSGRAFPDIAMYSTYFPLMNSGWESTGISAVTGTSLGAPLAAAIFTLANQRLLEDGYDVIGYANPMLYWMHANCTDALRDILVGDNQAGKGNGKKCLNGYPASPGWDAATGLGSIKFEPFVACAKRYQDEVRGKALEQLPDGSYRTWSEAKGSAQSGSMSFMTLIIIALLYRL